MKNDHSKSWEHYSRQWGFKVHGLYRIAGKKVTYRLDTERGSVYFSSVEKLLSQRSFRICMADQVKAMIGEMSKKWWESNVMLMLTFAVDERNENG
jgi:hypothetical protein